MPRTPAAERYRRRHAQRVASFFDGARRGRASHLQVVRWKALEPHLAKWNEIIETRNVPRST